jgi:flavin reductase (DIM6/NTAB) family NADH-FMN oxidoreductase RutF
MTTLVPVELPKAYRLLNHGPTVMVSSADKGTMNVMSAAWSMPLDFDPPKVAVGSTSGRDADKFAAHGIRTLPGSVVKAPLVDGCLAWLECRVIPEAHIQAAYDLFLAEVVAAWADPAVFADGHWKDDQGGKRSIHYIAGGQFFETGPSVGIRK